MAMFSSGILELIREKMVTDSFWDDPELSYLNSPSVPCYLTIHSGVQPSANTVNNNWETYNWGNATFLGGVNVTLVETSTSSFTISATTSSIVNNTGSAEWAAIWSRRISPFAGNQVLTTSSFTATIVPTSIFMIVPVSDITTTTGVVRINDSSVIAGGSFTISEITLKLGF